MEVARPIVKYIGQKNRFLNFEILFEQPYVIYIICVTDRPKSNLFDI